MKQEDKQLTDSIFGRSANSSQAVDELITKLNKATERRITMARARDRTDPALQLDIDFDALSHERALYDAQESLQILQLTLVLEYEQRKRTEKLSRIFDRTKLAESQVHLDLATCLIGNTADRARDAMDVLSTLCSNPNTQVEESLVKQDMPRETEANLFACIDTRRRIDELDQVAWSREVATIMSR